MSKLLNIADLHVLAGMCRELSIETPPPIVEGLHRLAVAAEHADPPPMKLLNLSDDEVRARVTDLAVRTHSYTNSGTGVGLAVGIEQFTSQLLAEVREETMPHLERIVAAMRPAFDAAAEPLVTAAQVYGYTWATTSDEVVDRADEEASTAWQDTRVALGAIQTVARMRIQLSRMFDLSPTPDDVNEHYLRQGQFDVRVSEDQLDYSVCFAEYDNWNFNRGFYIEPNRGGKHMLDWLALAAGGLRLNTPDEVHQKIHVRQTGTIVPTPEAA